MLDACWCEKHLAGDEGMSAARLHKPTGAGGDHVNLIARMRLLAPLWAFLSGAARRGPAAIIIVVAIGFGLLGAWQGRKVAIGDTQAGVPELRADSRYNLDSDAITQKFSIGVDVLNVIVETKADGCISYDVMHAIDEFAWHMKNVAGVQDVLSLAGVMRMVEADTYCVDVLKQTFAVRRAIEKAESIMLSGHLRTCVVEGIQNGRDEEVLAELSDLYEMKGK